MKKLILVCVLILLAGCATATYQNGDVKLTVKRPIFAAVSAGATSANCDTVTISTNTSVSIDQLSQTALAGYAQYMSGGLMKTPTVQSVPAVAVPRPDAQATPPPAEVVR